MYGLIWRRLPKRTWLRITISLLLIGVAGVVLWYVVFPWLEPQVPLDRVTVGR
ncbi:hypothetical protein J5X84_08070 [Streptosporangiaceae bacterium NEAU-GS5]|nr:hypothetical protein [Streptosporangiaceae bacterium NEAU-GS5]